MFRGHTPVCSDAVGQEVRLFFFFHAQEVASAQKDALHIFGDTPSEFLNKERVWCPTEQHLPSCTLCMPFEFQCMWHADHTFREKTKGNILDFYSKWDD